MYCGRKEEGEIGVIIEIFGNNKVSTQMTQINEYKFITLN